MKRTILAAALAVASFGAYANPPAIAQANSHAAAASQSTSKSVAYGGTGVGVGVGQGGGGGIGVGGNGGSGGVGNGGIGVGGQGYGGASSAWGGSASAARGSVNYNVPAQQTITHNGRTQVESVPNVYAPNIYPTAPCMGSSSAGAGWLGFGMSGGTSWTDRECQLQEAARNAPTPADRVFVWCKTDAAKGAPSCQGIVMPVETPADPAPSKTSRAKDATVVSGPGTEVWSGR